MADYTPLRSSVAAKAIAALDEFGGPMTAGRLCEEIGVVPKQIYQLLAVALHHGVIIKTTKIAAGLRGGKLAVFSLPSHGLAADPPIYGDAQERADDAAEASPPPKVYGKRPKAKPAREAASAVTTPAKAPRPAAAPVPARTVLPALDLGIEYQPLAQPARRPVGYWVSRFEALAAAPLRGAQLPTLRLPVDKHKAADSALRTWRKAAKPAAHLQCTRMPDHVLIQRIA